ncbi:MAG: hypothetical protein WCO99_15735, partial [Planctomycetota bacterium]
PDTGPTPTETVTEGSLWWKHEKLHRRAMASFATVGPEIRESFEALEVKWFSEGRALAAASPAEKMEFMASCWSEAETVTDRWIADLSRRNVTFPHQGFGAMWQTFNTAASLSTPLA